MNPYSKRKYMIEKYNPIWIEYFQNEKRTVEGILGEIAQEIIHVGSTAIPGMSGKSTIDVLVLVNDISVIDGFNEQFESSGYSVLGDFIHKGGRLFTKEKDGVRLSHIHIFEKTNPHVHEMTVFRDFLISHPDELKRYSDLKEELYAKYPNDYASYRTHKDAYVIPLITKSLLINSQISQTQQIPQNETDFKEKLTDEQYNVLRKKGTEAPFSGKSIYPDKDGLYRCAACGNALFDVSAKFESGTGWPSFDEALPGAIKNIEDMSHGMKRVEIVCAVCDSHLGHVFDNSPTKTGKYYCTNSVCFEGFDTK